jgi:prolyl 4-hydroxylase
MREYNLNQVNNFIEGYYLEDLSICDKLIELFENSNKKIIGRVGTGDVVKEIKESTDLNLFAEDIQKHKEVNDYMQQLNKSLTLYKQKYKYCDEKIGPWGLEGHFNIQKYVPGQAFHGMHCERASIKTSKRHLVWMTYLNDVKEGGETEFYHQKIKVKPEKGLTLIWSADWTFMHRGITTINEDKYIITGWFEFKE